MTIDPFAETWWSGENAERRDWCATREAYWLADAHPGVTTVALFAHWRSPDTVSACPRCQSYIERRVAAIKAEFRRKYPPCQVRGCGRRTAPGVSHGTPNARHIVGAGARQFQWWRRVAKKLPTGFECLKGR